MSPNFLCLDNLWQANIIDLHLLKSFQTFVFSFLHLHLFLIYILHPHWEEHNGEFRWDVNVCENLSLCINAELNWVWTFKTGSEIAAERLLWNAAMHYSMIAPLREAQSGSVLISGRIWGGARTPRQPRQQDLQTSRYKHFCSRYQWSLIRVGGIYN